MKRREFFRFVGRAFGVVVGLWAGVGAVRSSKAKPTLTWFTHQHLMNLRDVNNKMLAEASYRRTCLDGTGYIDHGDPLRFHPCSEDL